jgi:hypothetical protein
MIESAERLLPWASAVLAAVFAWVVWDARPKEWPTYQRQYYERLAELARTPAQRRWARSQRIELLQVEPSEIGGIERCPTCHLAVEDPAFEDGREPLRRHSPLLESHRPERFGCVACHEGEGRAATALEAHGYGTVRARPLLRGAYLQAACFRCHGESTLPEAEIASVLRGRALTNRMNCLACHSLAGEGGEEGPDLAGVGSRRNWLWLYAHLARPQAVTVGSTMPLFHLGRDEIRDITIYLMTLRAPRDPWRVEAPRRDQAASATRRTRWAPSREPSAAPSPDFVPDGRALFGGLGCRFCHRLGNRGGEVGPTLTYIGRRRSPEELQRLLRDPEDVLPGGRMPRLSLREEEVTALARFLSEQR